MQTNMAKLSGLIFSLLFTLVIATSSDLEEWNAFKLKYGKVYSNMTEYKARMEIFLENKHKIDEHNRNFTEGLATFQMGLNKYSDLTPEEFSAQMKGFRRPTLLTATHIEYHIEYHPHHHHHPHNHHHHHHPHKHHHHRHHHHHHRHSNGTDHLPSSIDWRDNGAVTDVQNQNSCGSCWAFAATGAIEGQYFRQTGKLVPLSVQNLVDCSSQFGFLDNCGGGNLDEAYEYVIKNGGINTAAVYEYEATDDVCKYKPDESDVKISGYKRIKPGDENALTEALATIGPISVSIDASSDKFDHYSSGIYTDPNCSSSRLSLDHSVLLVGYDTNERGEDYYIVKNSYGPDWGENGYFKIARNSGNSCGIATEAVYPII